MNMAISGGQGAVTVAQPSAGNTPAPDLPAAPQVQVPQAHQAASAAPQPSDEQLQRALDNLRRIAGPVAQNVQFSLDKGSGRTVIKVVDGSTKEVLRQIPSEEVLQMGQDLDRMSGLLVRDKA